MSEVLAQLLILVPLVVGGTLTLVATLLVEKIRHSRERRTALRGAYSRWLAGLTIASSHLSLFHATLKHESFIRPDTADLRSDSAVLMTVIKDLLSASKEVYLLENDAKFRERVADASTALSLAYEAVGRHILVLRSLEQSYEIGKRLLQLRALNDQEAVADLLHDSELSSTDDIAERSAKVVVESVTNLIRILELANSIAEQSKQLEAQLAGRF